MGCGRRAGAIAADDVLFKAPGNSERKEKTEKGGATSCVHAQGEGMATQLSAYNA